MSDGLQSEILRDPGWLLEDLKLIASQKSRIPDVVLDALVERAAKASEKIKPGTREWDRITRFFARERKLESDQKRLQMDRVKILLTVMAPQVAAAIQVNIDTNRASAEDEALNDLVARTTAETRAILDAHGWGRPDAGHPGDERPHLDGPGGNGEGGPEEPA